MARFSGLPGGFGGLGDMQKLMKQAQKMQEDAAKLQEELETARFTGTSGGGLVKVTVNGHGHVSEVKIDPTVADPDDVEMLEDLIVTAARDAHAAAHAEQESRMQEITGTLGDLNLPPGLLGT